MKKFIYVILFLFIILINCSLSFKAQDFTLNKEYYVLDDNLSTIDLEKAGYKLIDTNVNFKKCGIYYAEYEKDSNKYRQEIEIISLTNFKNGICEIEKIDTLSFNLDSLIDIKKTSAGYAAIGIVNDHFELVVKSNDVYKRWYIDRTDRSYITELVYDEINNTIYLAGTQKIKETYDVFLYHVKLDNFLFLGNTIYTTNKEVCCCFCLYQDQAYLSVLTDNEQMIYVIDQENLFLTTKYSLNINGGFAYKIYFENDRFYYLTMVLEKNQKIVKLYQYDTKFNLLKEPITISILNYDRMFSFKDIDNLSFITENNDYLTENKIINYYYLNNNIMEKVDFTRAYLLEEICGYCYKNQDFLFLTKREKNQEMFSILRGLSRNKDEININLNIHNKNVYLFDDLIYIIDEINKKIEVYNFNYLLLNNLNKSQSDEIYQPTVYSHYHNDCLNKELTIDDINPNLFGKYLLKFVYNLNNNKVILYKKVEVPLKKCLYEGAIYDKGFIIDVNSVVYVDGKLYNNEELVEEKEYEIELKGHNTNLIYHIQVKELNTKLNRIDKLNIDTNIKETKVDKMNISTLNKTINNTYEKDYSNSLWYLLIPTITTIVMTTLYFVIGRKY